MWICSCGLKNSSLNETCAAAISRANIEHSQISSNTPDFIGYIVVSRDIARDLERRTNMAESTDNEKLFAQYYNKGKMLVANMDDTDLREHREKLREIATEAKAHLMAADDEIRERGAKKKLKDKTWLVSVETDRASSDAINVVQARKSRMSKLDRIKSDLEKAGFDDDIIKEMMRGMEKRATEKTLKTITFHTSVKCSNCSHEKEKHLDSIGKCSICECLKFVDDSNLGVVQVVSNEPKPLFDPSSLVFGK